MEYITAQALVKDAISRVSEPWGVDIVDRVFQVIESDPDLLAAYEQMVRAHGQYPVENSIGLNIMGITGKKNTDRVKPAQSKLIQNYSELE